MHHAAEIPEFPGSYALFSDSAATRTAAVFVHGFMGDAAGTWRDFQGLIEDDAGNWNDVDLFFFDYDSFGRSVTGSAELLGRFVTGILARQIELMSVAVPDDDAYGGLSGRRFRLRATASEYENLWLLGHSLGGLVLRALIRSGMKSALKRSEAELADVTKPAPALLRARLRLFAPAISGARPARLLGLALRLGGLGSVARAVLGGSPSYLEMQQGSELLDVVRNDTTKWAEDERFERLTSLRAAIVWAERDDVVSDIEYRKDTNRPPRPPGSNHLSVCKPRRDYLDPLDFGANGKA